MATLNGLVDAAVTDQADLIVTLSTPTLQAALRKLSPDLREAVILRDLQEMEYREIADVLKVPEGTVKSRIRSGLKRMRQSLVDAGMEVSWAES